MTPNRKIFEIKGSYIVILLCLLTAAAGALFRFHGPRATAKSPGVLHLGVRYQNERTVEFLKYGKTGPDAAFRLIAPDGEVRLTFDDLRIGRNLVPLKNIPEGPYTARLEAEGFQPVAIPVRIEGRSLHPRDEAESNQPDHTVADRNVLGVRFLPRSPEK